ncbi:MAG: Cof-type HAD-IIB family hydrolase [Erysipelotrichaceae bacterium]|nr:Cof-type HAD-IIB family hydrolase [Erysipelotrichaceae bacterium]
MIKLIATDMDGTFLNSDKQFDKEFIDIFYEMKKQNIKFAIASGNQYYRLYQKFIPLSEQMYFVAENGGYIAAGAKELYSNIIKPEHVKLIRNVLQDNQRVVLVVCGKKGAYVLKEHFSLRNEVKKYYCNYSFVNSFDEVDDDIIKIAVYDYKQKAYEIFEEIKDQFPSELRIVTSGNEWVDIQNKDAHKGIGIQFLQMIYDINKDECMAFGDQMNDYEMLQQVKYGCAMANAVEPIKNIAYEVIQSNDEQGVLQKIKDVLKNNGKY